MELKLQFQYLFIERSPFATENFQITPIISYFKRIQILKNENKMKKSQYNFWKKHKILQFIALAKTVKSISIFCWIFLSFINQ